MGRLIRAVGHDLRDKLGVMKNSIYYLNMRLGHGDEKVQKHLWIVASEIANANGIVAGLMDFVSAKEPALQKSDVKAIVAEALSQASLPSHWEAIIHLEDGLPPLMAYAGQLQRAFTNMILKIIEGVPDGGKLRITARKQGRLDGDRVRGRWPHRLRGEPSGDLQSPSTGPFDFTQDKLRRGPLIGRWHQSGDG